MTSNTRQGGKTYEGTRYYQVAAAEEGRRERHRRLANEVGCWITRRWRSLWDWLDWFFSSSIRWLFLTFLFVYLIAMAMVLFEADGFQSLVSRLAVTAADPRDQAGTARQRDILQAVQEQDRLRQDQDAETARRDAREQRLETLQEEIQQSALATAQRRFDQARQAALSELEQNPGDGAQVRHDQALAEALAGLAADRRLALTQTTDTNQPVSGTLPQAGDGGAVLETGDSGLQVSIARQLDQLYGVIQALGSIGATATLQLRDSPVDRQATQGRYRALLAELGAAVEEMRRGLVEKAVGDLECSRPGAPGYRLTYGTGVQGSGTPASAAPATSTPRSAPPAPTQTPTYCVSLEAILAFEDLVGRLSDYDLKLAAPAPRDPRFPATPGETPPTQAQFKEDLDRLRLALPTIWELLPKGNQEVALTHYFADLDQALERLADLAEEPGAFSTGPDEGAPQEEEPGHRPPPPLAGSHSDLARLNPISAPLLGPQVVDLRAALEVLGFLDPGAEQTRPEVLDQTLVAAVRKYQETRGLTADGAVGRATREALNRDIAAGPGTAGAAVASPSPTPSAPVAGVAGAASSPVLSPKDLGRRFGEQEQRLSQSVDAIRSALKAQNIQLAQVSALTEPVANLRAAVEALAGIEVALVPSRHPEDGNAQAELSAQEKAREQLEQASAVLNQTFTRLKESFKQAGGDAHSIHVIAETIGLDDPQAHGKAATIWREFRSLARFQSVLTPLVPLRPPGMSAKDCLNLPDTIHRLGCRLAGIGFHAKDLAMFSRQNLDLMVVFVLGAIGSLVYITQYQLKQIIAGHGLTDGGATRYLSWYFFRPIFGVVIAFSIYLLYKTGQAALGAGSSTILSNEVNLPILALISLFAGLLSWQALETIESRGRSWLRAQSRDNLWATGLENALKNKGVSLSELAAQVGRTPAQVERWIVGRDKVTPEMQDRIATWLDRGLVELFSDTAPNEIEHGRLRWATGLAAALDNAQSATDPETLGALIGKDPDLVRAWLALRLQVDEASQHLLCEILERPAAALFSETRPDADWWALGLRAALERPNSPVRNATDLAAATGTSPESIRRYMELASPVPKAIQDAIATALGLGHSLIFSTKAPSGSDFRWAAWLRSAMQSSEYKRAGQLAEAVDAEVFRVRAWMEQELADGEKAPPYSGQVPPFTRKRLAQVLGRAEDRIFRAERAPGDFKWVVMPRFKELVSEHGGPLEFSERIDVDRARLERWMDGTEPVAAETQARIKEELGLPLDDDTLFEIRGQPDPRLPDAEQGAENAQD